MAVEVIKEGQFSTKYVKKCDTCDSIFTFKISDLYYNVEINSYYMYCPECGRRELYKEELLEKYDLNKKY